MSGASLSVPGLLHVGTASDQELAVLHVGPATGWVALKGLQAWSQEISVVLKAEMTEAIGRELGVTLPEAQPEAARLPNVKRAALASALVAVESPLVDKLVAKGVRVHTIGSDRTTGGFYYFAKGGAGAAVQVQGNLVEMVAPSLAASADNTVLAAYLDGVIGRLLSELSGGLLSEAQIELAAALPSLGEPASAAAAKLQTLEGYLVVTGTRATRYEDRARTVVEAVGQATHQGKETVDVPLFGSARRVVQPELEIEYAGGESGEHRKVTLPERSRWFVTGLLSETMPPPAVETKADAEKVAAEKAAAEKAAAEKAAAAKAAAEKAAAEKAAAEKAAAEKAAAEKAATAKAAAEKAATAKAAAEKAATAKAAAEKAAAEKAAAEKAATEKAAAEKAAAEKAAAEKAAAEKAAAEKAAAEKAAAEKAAAEKAAAEKAAAEKAAEKAAAEKAAAEKAATEKAAAEKAAAAKAATKKAAAEKAAGEKAAAEKAAAKKSATGKKAGTEKAAGKKGGKATAIEPTASPAAASAKPTSVWVWLVPVVLIAAAGGYYLAFMRHG